MFHFEREKYILILKSNGLDAALTELHKDKELMEQESFEGADGYNPESFEALEQFRALSRDLWDQVLLPEARK